MTGIFRDHDEIGRMWRPALAKAAGLRRLVAGSGEGVHRNAEVTMSTGIIVAVIVIVVIAAVAVVAGITSMRRRRLRERFGPEYDRVLEQTVSRRKAESVLTQRERRVKGLDIRPLDPATHAKRADQWRDIQERFVDTPPSAVAEAQLLIVSVMTERGYPTEHEGQVLADLSVGHAQTLDHYRAASGISARAVSGAASTEELRQAMIHYRVLFEDLLGEPADDQAAPGSRPERTAETQNPALDKTAGTPDPALDGTAVHEGETRQQQTPRT
jgi:Tfp pilus assembly protein PilX